jgi:hypothetical protein
MVDRALFKGYGFVGASSPTGRLRETSMFLGLLTDPDGLRVTVGGEIIDDLRARIASGEFDDEPPTIP